MKIEGIIEYNNNGAISNIDVNVDTSTSLSKVDKNVLDAISFALYGKTIFNDVINEKGVPLIALNIKDKGVYVVRQPEYLRETHFGTKYLRKDVYSLRTDNEEYESLTEEKYYSLLNNYVDISYDEFVAKCK